MNCLLLRIGRNKFCFTGGIFEASVQIPGTNTAVGMWPAIWSMGNLGRAGYGASLEGMWPYSYDACDVGTAPNQTFNGLPVAATKNGDHLYNGALSYLPGQKLSRCSCKGSDHPGPKHSDGSYVGRSAPEIDVLEAQVRYWDLIRNLLVTFTDRWSSSSWSSFTVGSMGSFR